MFWLLACDPPPALEVPVAPPRAEHATGMLAESFVGPLDVADLDTAALCTPDHAALVAFGHFGWRVLVVTAEGFALVDDAAATGKDREAAVQARVKQWAAADAVVAERCGETTRTPVLLAVDGATPYDPMSLGPMGLLEGLAVRVLVADPEPGPPVPAPGTRATGFYLTLAGSTRGWAVLGNTDDVRASEHADIAGATRRVVEAGHPEVVLFVEPSAGWSRYVEGLDALAGIGVVPRSALMVGDEPVAAPAPTRAPTRLVMGQVVPVLRYEVPAYVRRSAGTRTILFTPMNDPSTGPLGGVTGEMNLFGGAPTEAPIGPVR